MTCVHVGCPLPAVINRACAAHHDWAHRVLADPRYRYEEPPPAPKPDANGCVQGVLC